MKASRLVSAITGFAVQPTRRSSAPNAFAHESGIHQDGMLKNAADLRDHDARVSGPAPLDLVMASIRPSRVQGKAQGTRLPARRQRPVEDAFKRFKDLADRKKEIFDEDIVALVDDSIGSVNDLSKFVSLQVLRVQGAASWTIWSSRIEGVVRDAQAARQRAD